ncbi:hypothetical protein QTO34_004768 [Cnephaeus nilssonii]|uniref:NADH dehydrogenase [ubiquinone] 1 alpha subcomplex subunit 5 n=1 Tax=Cnephaeus nilssonii TaxID=3371016 RepID=A0AA40HPU2_CNENI|nr:hypothetical protein QTO34_004768 [Eptesicus nilssonii]
MASLLKKTTGLVGLAVSETPHEVGASLLALSRVPKDDCQPATLFPERNLYDLSFQRLKLLYTKILDVLEQIPRNAAYRKYTEEITSERLDMVKAEPDVKKLEDRLQGGQIEEVIRQAENELSLARKMIQWKPWEPLVDEPPANQWKWPI